MTAKRYFVYAWVDVDEGDVPGLLDDLRERAQAVVSSYNVTQSGLAARSLSEYEAMVLIDENEDALAEAAAD